jgi:hypothetical protein
MPLPKLLLEAAQAGYSNSPNATFKQAALGGGRSRFRLDLIGAPATVSVQWVCNPVQAQYLLAFIRSATATGPLPFLVDLILDDPMPAEYQAQLLPGTFGLGGTQGLSYTYRAQLEVVPMPPNPDADQSYLAIYSGYGDEGPDVLNLLSVLVNDRLTVLP